MDYVSVEGNDEEAHPRRPPSKTVRGRQCLALVEGAAPLEATHVEDVGLRLVDKKRPVGRSECEEVDPAAWHVVTEHHLGRGKPPEALEAPGDETIEPRVNRIPLPSPVVEMTRVDLERQPYTKHLQHTPDYEQIQRCTAASLDPADRRLRCRGLGGQVALSPADKRARLANKLSKLTIEAALVQSDDGIRHGRVDTTCRLPRAFQRPAASQVSRQRGRRKLIARG